MIEIIQQLESLDTRLFLDLNGLHSEWLDGFMYLVSGRFSWIPFYTSFLVLLLVNYRWKTALSVCMCAALVVLLCDQAASGFLKPLVERLRPSNEDNPISGMVHIVNGYRGGRYSFPSSHSANTWGVTFLAMFLAKRKLLTIFLACWAFLVSYSRIYLGVHYPGDLLVGFAIAYLCAGVVYLLYKRYFTQEAACLVSRDTSIRYGKLPYIVGAVNLLVLWVWGLIVL